VCLLMCACLYAMRRETLCWTSSTTCTIVLQLFFCLPMVSCSWMLVPRSLVRRNHHHYWTSTSRHSAAFLSWRSLSSSTATARNMRKLTTQIPCPPSPPPTEPSAEQHDNNFSLEHLQQRTQWLIDHHTALGKVCLAIAGGGGHALSTLAATSGASQLLLEGTVTYDRSAFQTYVGKALPDDKRSNFSYSSLDAAQMAAQSALLQGMQLQARNRNNRNHSLTAVRDTVGLGSASTLKNNHARRYVTIGSTESTGILSPYDPQEP
jgi:hypothetical protein